MFTDRLIEAPQKLNGQTRNIVGLNGKTTFLRKMAGELRTKFLPEGSRVKTRGKVWFLNHECLAA